MRKYLLVHYKKPKIMNNKKKKNVLLKFINLFLGILNFKTFMKYKCIKIK